MTTLTAGTDHQVDVRDARGVLVRGDVVLARGSGEFPQRTEVLGREVEGDRNASTIS